MHVFDWASIISSLCVLKPRPSSRSVCFIPHLSSLLGSHHFSILSPFLFAHPRLFRSYVAISSLFLASFSLKSLLLIHQAATGVRSHSFLTASRVSEDEAVLQGPVDSSRRPACY